MSDLFEKLAAIEHDRWSNWHKHAVKNWNQTNLIGWDRQSNTPYAELTEREKESDRREVRRYFYLFDEEISRLKELLAQKEAEILKLEIERVNRFARAERIIDWLNDPNRKSAIHAFTEGPERQIAYAVEKLLSKKEAEAEFYLNLSAHWMQKAQLETGEGLDLGFNAYRRMAQELLKKHHPEGK